MSPPGPCDLRMGESKSPRGSDGSCCSGKGQWVLGHPVLETWGQCTLESRSQARVYQSPHSCGVGVCCYLPILAFLREGVAGGITQNVQKAFLLPVGWVAAWLCSAPVVGSSWALCGRATSGGGSTEKSPCSIEPHLSQRCGPPLPTPLPPPQTSGLLLVK